MALKDVPPEVRELYQAITALMDSTDDAGKRWGNAQFGAYCFYDFDDEPIYVGRTTESLRTRIRRHLTNQRTDAVAMNVLDPYEVASVEMWPLWELEGRNANDGDVKHAVQRLEWSIYVRAVNLSKYRAVLNEGDISPIDLLDELPASVRRRVSPLGWEDRNRHPDVRTARRADTIARLAKVCAERDVSPGLRRTLVTQAERLLTLARDRADQLDIGWTDVPQLHAMHPLLTHAAVKSEAPQDEEHVERDVDPSEDG